MMDTRRQERRKAGQAGRSRMARKGVTVEKGSKIEYVSKG